MSYKKEQFGIGTTRLNYQKNKNELEVFDLLKIQTDEFKKFIETGIEEIFKEIYPISSTKNKLRVEFIKLNLELPKNREFEIKEAKSRGANFYAPLKAKFRIIEVETGEKLHEDESFICNLPLMTDGGSFIINGSERVIISQIVRAPGAYFEHMKASRAQSASDASVFKLASILPNRGAWFELDYKDYKLLGTDPGDIKLKIDKSKRIKATQLLNAFGIPNIEIRKLFANNDLIIESIRKVKTEDSEPFKSRSDIFKVINAGDRLSQNSVNEAISQLLFNRRRYDLSRTGRYKMNAKLSPYSRILDRILAADVLDVDSNVIASKGTLVTKELALKINELQTSNQLKLTDLRIDPVVLGKNYLETLTEQEKRLFSQVNLIKVFVNKTDYNNVEYPEISNIISNSKVNYEHLTISDIIATYGYMINLEQGVYHYDDIDSLSNRKLKTINDLLKNQFRIGLTRIEKNLRDRISAKILDGVTVKSITNHKLMESAIKDFFNSSQLSQFMDQINPLAEISNKRRITSLGPGGLSRDTASLIVRGIHNTHYGRIDPIETPEGPNIGLILNLAIYSRVNKFGLLETPYFKVKKGIVDNEAVFLTSDLEENELIAPATINVSVDRVILDKEVIVRQDGKFITVNPEDVTLMDVSPRQTVSVATAHIPFLEHDDANRALMGANMQRQAIPLIRPEAPIVATGIEEESAKYSPTTIKAEASGKVLFVDSTKIIIEGDFEKTYELEKFVRSNQGSTINQIPKVKIGENIKMGQIIADGPSVDNGELAIGQNPVVAFTTWRGYNYEDAIILSERLVKDDVYTSIHIEEHKIEQRSTKLGEEQITGDITNASKESLRNLDEDGIIIIGSQVKVGDVLVGKITPKGEDDLSPEEKLLDAILGNKAKNTRDSSLRVPYSAEGIVQDIKILSKENGDKLNDGVEKIIKVFIAQKRKIQEGDKMSGRHGNKGVISRVLPVEDMPYLEDGTPVDMMLNPLGVPSRMNVGQVLELHLGMAAKKLGVKVSTPIFNGATPEDVATLMAEAEMNPSGKFILTDGITGDKYENPIAVGVMYMLKLSHMIDDKMHARSIGPYSLITQQPLRGKSQNGGQRFGEMEAWALEAYGASNILQEMFTLKSDDIKGRNELYNAIAKGKRLPTPSIPEGFWVLFYEMRGLGLTITFLDEENNKMEIDNTI
ncbi:MAG: DNA-directed RNA polymerase subunit beta [Mycoplasmataceae bacterium]|nr:DNA-directed RNA polymerase subunit beta [Mycoplasmataceae bacterium]